MKGGNPGRRVIAAGGPFAGILPGNAGPVPPGPPWPGRPLPCHVETDKMGVAGICGTGEVAACPESNRWADRPGPGGRIVDHGRPDD
jgi:hypothetical protein